MDCVTIRSSLSIHWVQYSISEYFLGNYEKSLFLIDSVLKSFEDTMKKQEYHEVILFKTKILFKLKKYEECIDVLEKNLESKCVDRITFYENIIKDLSYLFANV